MEKPTMTRATIAGGAFAIVLVLLALAAGQRALEQDVDPAAATSPANTPSTAAAEAHPSFLYGRVTTHDGAAYKGRLRWGGDEEPVSRRLTKPGPATSADAISGCRPSRPASSAPRSRGFIPAGFASTMAALVERSPSAASRGGSTDKRAVSSPPGSLPSVARYSISALITPNI